jgi:hypothetical protein
MQGKWVPAFAGMTDEDGAENRLKEEGWVPAFAGMTDKGGMTDEGGMRGERGNMWRYGALSQPSLRATTGSSMEARRAGK